jgi:hypothetical protein
VQQPPNEEKETMQAPAVGGTNAKAGTAFMNSVYSQAAPMEEMRQQSPSISVYGRCIRGFMVGICLEGVLALCLYGIYHLGQILH